MPNNACAVVVHGGSECKCIKEGEFRNLPLDKLTKECVEDAYQAANAANAWDWLRDPDNPGSDGFMFCDDPMVGQIMSHMKRMSDHSGASFGFTMRVVEYIAKHGWDSYVNMVVTCPCYKKIGRVGWCGVAGGGVPACEH